MKSGTVIAVIIAAVLIPACGTPRAEPRSGASGADRDRAFLACLLDREISRIDSMNARGREVKLALTLADVDAVCSSAASWAARTTDVELAVGSCPWPDDGSLRQARGWLLEGIDEQQDGIMLIQINCAMQRNIDRWDYAAIGQHLSRAASLLDRSTREFERYEPQALMMDCSEPLSSSVLRS